MEGIDTEFTSFDFKWTMKNSQISFDTLQPKQIVNHFDKGGILTTKSGLTQSLKNLVWFTNVDYNTFYPRCYDLSLKDELEEFVQEYKQVKAQSYLKIYVREMKEAYQASRDAVNLQSPSVGKRLLKVALRVCKNRTRSLDELIDDPNGFGQVVSDADWSVLSADELTQMERLQKKTAERIKKEQ